ncbi:MAG TPA: GNAT family N-acetyltransferase [Acidimicrobiia bacterium]|nr:GNAT family N-acetyltransferase [Acidimicrobiia bacterium]
MEIRALTLDDIPELTRLINRFERHWQLPLVSSESVVEDEMTEPFTDLSVDTRGYWLDGKMVAYGFVWHRPSGERQERAYLMGLVDPDFRGQGIGRHLLAWEIDRARESLAGCEPSLPWYIRANEWDWIEDAHRLHRRFGLKPVRYMREMLRPLDVAVEIAAVPGIEIVPWDRELDERARIATNEAFRDHWGSTPVDADTFRHRLEGEGSRLDLSFLALAGDEVVGVCLNAVYPEDEAVTGRREGWVMTLAVLRPWRGKGVAKALLATSFVAFRDAGLTHTMIGVDAENPTGAFSLYENLGYEAIHGTTTFELQVNPPPPA